MSHELWRYDRRIPQWQRGLVGVDEAGRGCLAGPVVAAAVHLPASSYQRPWGQWKAPRIDDSKRLSKDERQTARAFLDRLKGEGAAAFAVGMADIDEIEALNILGATTLAMRRALEGLGLALASEAEDLPLWTANATRHGPPRILVDGRPVAALGYVHEALVGGDGKSLAIALASVLAKVERDRWMARAHADYPAYGWDTKCGYGTAAHRAALRRTGPCPLHRKLFLRKILAG